MDPLLCEIISEPTLCMSYIDLKVLWDSIILVYEKLDTILDD